MQASLARVVDEGERQDALARVALGIAFAPSAIRARDRARPAPTPTRELTSEPNRTCPGGTRRALVPPVLGERSARTLSRC